MRYAKPGMLLVLMVATLTGCGSTPTSQRAVEPTVIDAGRYEPVYRAAVDVLRDRGFRVDRQDYRFGRITTTPAQSPTVFEPWHGDNSTATQALASTADHLQRRVTVMLDPAQPMADGGSRMANGDAPSEASGDEVGVDGYTLTVEVLLERRVYTLRRLTGTAERRRLDTLAAVPAEWKERGITESYAQPIGRDAEMERALVAEILARAGGE